ncbi:hypothetical protein [Zavarzinella formosa]|uniref:hypothetical protein n=1 Tax=Zavarzinella formosa TaxID=360055 RepID=UPI00036002C6|nr:hypothetical protein [Zavarzinella formosa]
MRHALAGCVFVLLIGLQGCGLQSALDSFRIQGTWVGSKGGKLVFYSDGSCEINSRQGKYEVMAGNRLKITTKGMLWGENEEVVTYSILSTSSIQINAKILGFEVSDTFQRQ